MKTYGKLHFFDRDPEKNILKFIKNGEPFLFLHYYSALSFSELPHTHYYSRSSIIKNSTTYYIQDTLAPLWHKDIKKTFYTQKLLSNKHIVDIQEPSFLVETDHSYHAVSAGYGTYERPFLFFCNITLKNADIATHMERILTNLQEKKVKTIFLVQHPIRTSR